jgi:hypothetical protein
LYHFNVYFTTEIENIYVPEDICLEKFCWWLEIKLKF